MKNRTIILILCALALPVATIAQHAQLHYLSGTGAGHQVEWQFKCTDGRQSGEWKTINVPSCWEQEGYGEYNYGHVPFDDRLKEEGYYKYTFQADENWEGKHINIVFDGVMTDCSVRINGKPAGPVHQGAFTQFKYDISDLLNYGEENLLEVHVKKHSDDGSVNQAERKADYWIFGGIFRPVYLEIKPEENIERVAVDARADGSFLAHIYIIGHDDAEKSRVILSELGSDTEIASFESPVEDADKPVVVEGKAENIKAWNPESPVLYEARFQLLDGDGNTIHEHLERIGFRTVEVRPQDGIYVNGQRIRFKGVNRHTFHPDFGRTSSKRMSVEAVLLMKEMNMNAVRMSHYPPDKHFLDACDSLGLFVLDELSGWQSPPYDTEIGRKLLIEMVIHDQNHPSIVLWDNGNEGGWNTAYDDEFAKWDLQQRKVVHPWAIHGDLNAAHYILYRYLSNERFNRRKIFFPTEFLHGLYDGGHGAGLEDYWLRMWNDPLCAGGFLWVFADEAVMRTDWDSLDADGNHAPDGILGPYLEKEGSYYTIRQIWSPVFIEERFITPQFNGIFNIENRYHYTHFSECTFEYRFEKLPGLYGGERGIIAKGKAKADPLKPNERGQMHIPLAENWQEADVLILDAYGPDGRLINTWSWAVKQHEAKAAESLRQAGQGSVEFTEEDGYYLVESGDVRLKFSKTDGTLQEVKNSKGIVPLSNGPLLVGLEKEEDTEIAPAEVKAGMKDGSCQVSAMYEKELFWFTWTVMPGGRVDIKVNYKLPRLIDHAGISFGYDENQVAGMRWLGNGPYRVWKNRSKGARFDYWEKAYNNTITGYSGFEYPEFKGYHANLHWADVQGKDQPGFKVICHDEDIFLRMLTPGEAPEAGRTSVDHPAGDISFLHGIPPIGSKFKEPQYLGPESQQYISYLRRLPENSLVIRLSFDFR